MSVSRRSEAELLKVREDDPAFRAMRTAKANGCLVNINDAEAILVGSGLPERLAGAVAFTPLERDALLGLVSMIANDGLDTYGLSGKEQAAVGRALAKLARRQ